MQRYEEISKRIVQWFKTGKSYPYEMRINPTNKCNLFCLPCVSRGRPTYKKNKELSTKTYLRIIKEASEIRVRRVDVCGGGEPFARNDTIKILKEIKENGMEGTISTNGTLIKREIAKKLVEMEWDEIRFSINGPNEEIDDYLRGVKGAFKLSLKAIGYLNHFKKKFKKEKPKLIIMPVITSFNYRSVAEFVKLSVDLKVDSLILQPFMSEVLPGYKPSEEERRKISKKLMLSEKQAIEFRKVLKEAKKVAEKSGLNTNIDSLIGVDVRQKTSELIKGESKKYKKKYLKIPCYVPWWDLDISVEGEVGPCFRADKRFNLRDISLDEAWNSDYFNSFRKMLAEGKIPNICKDCCAITTYDNQKIREKLSELS
ncbi:MAG: radical SAM protein [Candidatus Aenigmarchaeota archaeon]|nr:radical SAM protein [Candidatus Aenigmarchaeota archaeon]